MTTRRAVLLLALFTVAISGAVFSFRLSSSYVFASTQPMLAMSIGGANAEAAGRLANAEYVLGKGKTPLSETRRKQLLDGLRSNPLSRRAIAVLGLDAEMVGNNERAHRLMTAGHAISRRDRTTQFWLLKEAIVGEDWSTAFRHLDAAISTNDSTWQQLFPILVQGLAYPEVRQSMVPSLRSGRFWSLPFLTYAIDQSPNPQDIVRLMREAEPLAQGGVLTPLKAKLVARFAALGRINEAASFAREELNASEGVLDDIGIKPETVDALLVPLAWQVIQQPNIATELDPERGSAVFSAGPGPRSVPLTRHLVLEPGRYRFSFAASVPPISEAPESEWAISCISGNQPILIATVPVNTRSTEGNAITFDLPARCPGAVFSLVIMNNAEGSDSAIQISDLSLVRSR